MPSDWQNSVQNSSFCFIFPFINSQIFAKILIFLLTTPQESRITVHSGRHCNGPLLPGYIGAEMPPVRLRSRCATCTSPSLHPFGTASRQRDLF